VILGKFQLRVMHRDIYGGSVAKGNVQQAEAHSKPMFGIAVKLSFARQPNLIYVYVEVYNPYKLIHLEIWTMQMHCDT